MLSLKRQAPPGEAAPEGRFGHHLTGQPHGQDQHNDRLLVSQVIDFFSVKLALHSPYLKVGQTHLLVDDILAGNKTHSDQVVCFPFQCRFKIPVARPRRSCLTAAGLIQHQVRSMLSACRCASISRGSLAPRHYMHYRDFDM